MTAKTTTVLNMKVSPEIMKWIDARRHTPWGTISRTECARKIIEIAYQQSETE